ncbi:MAG: class I SAM-dependent methyltransferase [bacterium]
MAPDPTSRSGGIAFADLQRQTIGRYRALLSSSSGSTFDAQALPAYTNPNPLMRWLFWERVRVVINELDQYANMDTVLDFGCGMGTMLPYLDCRAQKVIALDQDIRALEEVINRERWKRVHPTTDFGGVQRQYAGEVDLILAMDVLEHVDDLDNVLQGFARLLKPGGHLIVTGPTENIWYKMGRFLAQYSGDYHKTNIHVIRRAMEYHFRVDLVKTLVPVVPLFLVLRGGRKQVG